MLVGCCLLQGGSMGLINNCRGVFFSPVTEDLGFSMGGFTMYLLVAGIAACVITPLASRIFTRFDSRWLLGVMSLFFSASEAAMGLFHTLSAFYINGVIQGISSVFLMFFPAPLILGQWFKKRTGLAIGVSSAFSGLIGILFNPIGSAIIERFGWRMGFAAFGLIAFLMTFPVSVFLLRIRPSDLGLEPYGEEEAAEAAPPERISGVPASKAKRTVGFWLLVTAGFLLSILGAFNSHLSPLGINFGYGARIAALLVSASMMGNLTAKIILGPLYDRKGLAFSLGVGLLVPAAGFVLLLVDSIPVRLAGAFLYGFIMGTSNIMMPLVVKDVYGLRGYGWLLAFTTTALTLGNAFSAMVGGWMVDLFGPQQGYIYSFRGCLAAVAMIGLLLILAIRSGRRLARKCMSEI